MKNRPLNHSTEATELVIFDCDGVLIDSETIVCRLVSEELTRLGYPVSVDAVIRRFPGRPEREVIAEIEEDRGQPVPHEYFTRTAHRIEEAYATELRAIGGVHEFLDHLRVPACVTSSSYPEKVKPGLKAAGLHKWFGSSIVDASRAVHEQPASDLFVYAAGWMRTRIPNCVVIEDSIPGVCAARRAGMRVFGFTGASHCTNDQGNQLRAAGAEAVVKDLRELWSLLPAAFKGFGRAPHDHHAFAKHRDAFS